MFSGIQQDPAERFREGIEDAGAASAKIEFELPLNTGRIPLRRMNEDEFEGIGNVRFGEPSSVPCELDHLYCIIH
ncbi:hypothetical protein CesoFtcFv8_017019 [Champsocephalus esox]|uniref:Uncharacterized protein n=1 Tax=Champsocephalus esox TaxID=159716 RepID=A0AAN8BJF4_9TELE|nr:hypothetical protein CesoFtcFv8_017019 [Champsocephalus esox]